MNLEANDAISSILGWTSIACWIIVYSPQLYENYTLQSGEGLSILFILVWLVGDLCNLVGATLAGLLPTVIILAVYYSVCDLALLCQVYYYRWKDGRPIFTSRCDYEGTREETTPLLPGDARIEDALPMRVLVLRYAGAVVFIFATGILAWWISGGAEEDEEPRDIPTHIKWTVQILGWTSAVLYLGARIPQIAKNFQTRCAGLSPALFFFSIFGNVTYALSICAKSMDKDYLVTNASWLAGSGLTVFLDIIILCQIFFFQYLPALRKAHVAPES
ncbi:PQ loop repeat-domain-containing protein [Desarmillaria tabescens]|uniref:PQ loop repeat-domain-containing protein n=1 Tax=Armillaria tabescens TaxID=1929756 RepID=A0AA39U0E0_ARMTA|nr:PQ loop repeat-domain-containing protein [Desarmillaria tabescens]KAK0464460.1 PQ loop repeat-domain-containing protein [Desarmillaria tabescens]